MDAPGTPETARISTRSGALRGALFVLAIACVVAWVNRADLPGLLRITRGAPAGLCLAALVHAPQIMLTGFAWAILIPRLRRPGTLVMSRLRWFREGAAALLPAGGLVGQMLAARALILRGLPSHVAAATATVDLTIEAATQLLFTLGGLLLLMVLQGATRLGLAVALGLVAGTAGVAALIALQRRMPLRWLRAILARSPCRAPARWLARMFEQAGGVQRDVRRLHAEPVRLGLAAGLHMLAWAMGAVEVWGVLRLIGLHVGPVGALVVESVAQALRTAGFLLPGGIGVQEAAIVAACALVGVPPAPSLALALVRRTREVLFGVSGLALYGRLGAPAPAS